MSVISKIFVLLAITIISCSSMERNIIATVDNQKILVEDFLSEMSLYRGTDTLANIASSSPRFLELKKTILNDMIREKILIKEAAKLKITVGEDEIKEMVASVEKDYPGDSLRKFFRAHSINSKRWEEKIKNSLIVKKLTEKITEGNTKPTEESIVSYYEKNKDKFTLPERIHAFQIVVKTEEEAYKIYRELTNGKKFEDLAMEFSIALEAQKGGDMGFYSKGSMPKVFDDVLFKLKQGKISKVVSSDYGFHIFKVTDRKQRELIPLENVKNDIVNELTRIEKDQRFSNWFKEKITRAKIKRNNALLANIKYGKGTS